MDKTENKEVNEKCTMSISGSCCHPEIVSVKQEISCNGSHPKIEHCPMFLRKRQENQDQTKISILSVEKMLDIGNQIWNDIESVVEARKKTNIEKNIDALEEQNEDLGKQIAEQKIIAEKISTKVPRQEQEREKDPFEVERIILPLTIGLIKEDSEKIIEGVNRIIRKCHRDNLSEVEFEQILELGTRMFKDITESAVKKALQKTDIEKKVDALQEENDNLRKQIAEPRIALPHG